MSTARIVRPSSSLIERKGSTRRVWLWRDGDGGEGDGGAEEDEGLGPGVGRRREVEDEAEPGGALRGGAGELGDEERAGAVREGLDVAAAGGDRCGPRAGVVEQRGV